MTTLIVGGDRINTYKDYLASHGYGPVLHWNGRNNSECHKKIPARTRLVVIMVDQVNHRLAIKMREIADSMNLPVIFSRRSIAQLEKAIERKESAETARLLQ